MSEFDDKELTPEDGRRVAMAEYVLGLGSTVSRAAMARAIETDPALASEARFWESRFAQFNEDYEPVPAPSGAYARIETALFGEATASALKTAWYNTVSFWRGLTGLAVAAFIIAIGVNIIPLTQTVEPVDTSQLVASMAATDDGAVNFLARYDAQSGELRLSGSGDAAGAGSDYELWYIEGENAPVSMGVIQVGDAQSVSVDPALRERMAQGITLAVTRETEGGSPTGAPQGPIVAAGAVAAI